MRKNRQKCKHNGGFTLVETLVVVAILVVLLAVSAVSVIRYRDVLKIVELDNAAREIYMAAENRAVLLKDSAKMRTLSTTYEDESSEPQKATIDGVEIHYVTKDYATNNDLLTTGAIDPALLDGNFYIVYEPESGAVTDVFYVESGSDIKTIEHDFEIASNRNERIKRKNSKGMLGYYGGESSGSLDYTSVSNPGVNVEITNDEILTVEVTFTLPEGYDWGSADMTVELTYGDNKVILFNNSNYVGENRFEETKDGNTMVCTWVLDKLDYDGTTDLHFKDLFGDTTVTEFGDNFTVKAAIELRQEGSRSSTATASNTNNSLFASVSGDTASIKCLRHLQNLDAATSGVKGVTSAVQIADIKCKDNFTYENYAFIPIQNSELTSYVASNGSKNYEIRELNVTADSAKKGTNTVGAGLFAILDGSDKTDGITITGLRLVNAQVNGSIESGSVPAGAVAGRVLGTVTFNDCRVYWEEETDEVNGTYTDLLGSSDSETGYIYQIIGSNAGGLVGSVSGSNNATTTVTITSSFAATMVSGKDAGGLIGLVGDNAELDVSVSYADCYLQGTGTGAVGGLVGSCETTDLTLTNVYTAGFVDGNDTATSVGGICGSSAGGTSENVYAAMYYTDVKEGATCNPGVPGADNDSCYYMTDNGLLGSSIDSNESNGTGLSYESMTTNKNFIVGEKFESKDTSATHPYNLRAEQNLTYYSYPGLKGLPHYGDWKSYFEGPSLVYYEEYSRSIDESTYGFSGGQVSSLANEDQLNKAKAYIKKDGYAMVMLTESVNNGESLSITYTVDLNENKSETDSSPTLNEITYDGKPYYLIPLPDNLVVNRDYANTYYYQYLKVTFDGGLKDGVLGDSEYFYNPHFANTVVPYSGEALSDANAVNDYIAENLPKNITVSIRTPRHLYDLSYFEEYYYYNNNGGRLSFVQELNLDYNLYTGYDFFGSEDYDSKAWPKQKPIGTSGSAFNGTYNGVYHYIKNVPMDWSNPLYSGLFGYSGGTLKNIVFIMNTKTPQSVSLDSSTYNIGALVGYNNATVSNCAVAGVNLQVNTGSNTKAYIGGLVGYNVGLITNSAAEVASVDIRTTSICTIYAGGLVGKNTHLVSKSYAVGSMSATTKKDTEKVYLCGFVGENATGTVNNSYAAMDLKADGDEAFSYGFCHDNYSGTQENTYYLDGSTFTYRGESYLAGFDKTYQKAQPATYAQLTGSDKDKPITLDEMEAKVPAKYKDDNTEYTVDGDDFPYFSAVTDANGYYVHYGLWPARMNMGNMGVYYWEELERNDGKTYHISILAVNTDNTITKDSTLSTLHDEGGEVTRYGYGFYNSKGVTVTVSDDETLYYSEKDFAAQYETLKTQKESKTDTDENDPLYLDKLVDEALASQTEGIEFHSFHTYEIDKDSPTGLYPAEEKQNCTLTLTQGEGTDTLSVTFTISPFFADALAVAKPGDGWTLDSGIETTPGDVGNPYEVRSVSQLQLINWNYKEKDAHIVMDSNNSADFRYLNSNDQTTKYNWTQTYDLVGSEENGDNKTTTPIAEYYDTTRGGEDYGTLYGWFGGVYDGGGYKIENVNVEGHELSSCVGLFGVVYNGTLKDIVLYSSNGNGKISTLVNKGTSQSCWFAMGALAGVAGTSSDNSESAIQNCSVAGYTIEATAFTATGGWGGNCIGGMVGESNMNLSGCSAVVYVNIHDAVENDNMRVGGLVGACQDSVIQCYAGGEIAFINEVDENGEEIEDSSVKMAGNDDKTTKGIYVGGLVGGSYIKPLAVNGSNDKIGKIKGQSVDNALINCYSYVTLPCVNAHTDIRGLYAVGGTGEIDPEEYSKDANKTVDAGNYGSCKMINCFYLRNEVLKRNQDVEMIDYASDSTKYTYSNEEAVAFGLWTKAHITDSSNRTPERPGKTDMNYYYIPNKTDGGFRPDWDNYPVAIPVTYEELVGLKKIKVPVRDSEGKISGGYTTKNEYPQPIFRNSYDYKKWYASAYTEAQDIYFWLNDNSFSDEVDTNMFDKVRTEVNNISVPGRYSYPTDEHPELKDLNYPFPTNQTVVIDDAGTKAHVHYGDWPLSGFYRASVETNESDTPIRLNYLGIDPIEIDLFAGSEYTEYLVLSDVGTGGNWTCEFEGDTHPEVTIDDKNIKEIPINGTTYTAVPMTVKGNTAGTFPLTITYDKGGELTVYINVDAKVQLEPEKVYMFPDDSVTVNLAPYNSEDKLLTNGTMSLTNLIVLGSEETLTAEPTGSSATFTTSGADLATYTVNAMFSYTVDGQSYDCEDAIEIEVIQPWTVEWEEVVEDPPPDDEAEEGTTTGKQYVNTITIPGTYPLDEKTATNLLFEDVTLTNQEDLVKALGEGGSVTVETDETTGSTTIVLTYPPIGEITETLTLTNDLTLTMNVTGPDDVELSHNVTITVSKTLEPEQVTEPGDETEPEPETETEPGTESETTP